MTKAQRKIVCGWVVIALLVCLFLIFSELILEYWDYIKFPMLIVIIVIVSLSKQRSRHKQWDGMSKLNRIVEEYPWVKVYYAIYCLLIAIIVNYIIFNDIILEVSVKEYFLPFALLILPIIIVQQKEAYVNAGKKI